MADSNQFQGVQETRKAAREAIDVSWVKSLGTAGRAFCVVATPLSIIGGALKWMNELTRGIVVGLACGAVISFFAVLLITEFDRLTTCRKRLDALLHSDRNFEDLLRAVQNERDEARRQLASVETGLAIERAVTRHLAKAAPLVEADKELQNAD